MKNWSKLFGDGWQYSSGDRFMSTVAIRPRRFPCRNFGKRWQLSHGRYKNSRPSGHGERRCISSVRAGMVCNGVKWWYNTSMGCWIKRKRHVRMHYDQASRCQEGEKSTRKESTANLHSSNGWSVDQEASFSEQPIVEIDSRAGQPQLEYRNSLQYRKIVLLRFFPVFESLSVLYQWSSIR